MIFLKRGKLSPDQLIENVDPKKTQKLIYHALIRRNIYLALFIISFICIIATALLNEMTLCILSLSLSTLSLVIMTKYDTHLFFLKILKETNERKNVTPDHS